VTAERAGRRQHETQLAALGVREVFLTQIDLRIHRSDAELLPPFLPIEANTWVDGNNGWEALWLGPDEWLMLANPGSRELGRLIPELETLLSGMHHSIVDVSASRAVIELTAPDRHDLLSSGCGLDLHHRSWRDGMCAQTLLARVPVILQERARETLVFVRPSFLDYLVDWFVDAAGLPR
jgi:sarcosine oxidase subunit gamma